MNEIALTAEEAADLAQLEAVIERGMHTFIEVGAALYAIRDQDLYRKDFETFEAYCRERWGFSDSRARQLIGAAQTVTTVTVEGLPAPTSERQARELIRIPEPERVEVWRETVARTGGQPTAAAVRETYAARTDEVIDAELVDEPAPRTYSAPPTPERAPDRQPRVDVSRTILVAITELRQTREALQGITAGQLARQDEETRRIWAARLNTELEALTDFHNTLIKEIHR